MQTNSPQLAEQTAPTSQSPPLPPTRTLKWQFEQIHFCLTHPDLQTAWYLILIPAVFALVLSGGLLERYVIDASRSTPTEVHPQ